MPGMFSWVTCLGERLNDECMSCNTVIEATVSVVCHKDPDCSRLDRHKYIIILILTEILDILVTRSPLFTDVMQKGSPTVAMALARLVIMTQYDVGSRTVCTLFPRECIKCMSIHRE